jgi:DNA-binding beta-propeller fold protein YncE
MVCSTAGKNDAWIGTQYEVGNIAMNDARMVTTRLLVTVAFFFCLLAGARGQTPTPASAPIKVEYVNPITAGETRKLLGMSGNRLYVARKNGNVDVINADGAGQVLLTLQAKDARGEAVLGQAQGVAVSDDTLYVLDSDKNQVAMFSADGQYKGKFGNRGSGLGELSSPQGIALFEGIVYVADSGNGRIQMYGDNGVFLATLGIDSAPSNKGLEEKNIPYKLDKPVSVGVDRGGQIYVLDAASALFSDKSLIKVYSQDGSFLRPLPKNGKPVAMDIAADGLYVADEENYAVQKFDSGGKLVSYFGSRGDGRAQFMSLSGLALEGGHIFVGDSARGVIHHFRTSAPPVLTATPKQTAIPFVRWQQATAASVGRMAWDGKDTLYAVARDKPAIVRIRKGVTEEMTLKDISPTALAFDKSGALWVLDKKKARVSKLDGAGNPVLSFGSDGSRNGQFDEPGDLVISAEGNIYVADTGNSRIQAFSSDGVFFKVFDNSLSGKLKKPAALAIDARDNLYVLDTSRASVTVYSPNGDALREFGGDKSREADRLKSPVAVMAGHDEVFVLDSDRVRVYSPDGKSIRAFGASGQGNGELAEADNMARKDAASFFISERGTQRVQSFTTVYKPGPPEQLTAQGEVHAIELRWAASPLPYVSQYQVYRSRSENGDFVRIGVSKTVQFSDANLPPDEQYFYRVAAATGTGHEGLPGPVTGAAARKYTPPLLENAQLVPTTTKLKISWKPIDSRYVNGYLVYQKDGEKFTRLAETTAPEFQLEGLIPGTAYTYYLAARGVDGVESEKLAVQTRTLADTRAPLEMDAAELHNIFSNTYKLYEQEGVGRIKLTNNTSSPMANIKVSFMLNNFMDFPTESRIDVLAPGEIREVTLKAVFNNNILSLTEDTPVQAKLEASYFENGQPRTYSKIRTINIYDKHRLGWDERGRYAAFVTPKDPLLINFTRSVAAEFGALKEPTQLAAAVFSTLGALGVTYVQDPINPYQVTSNKTDYVDYIQYPRETMKRKSGDCDDLVALYSASLESLGIPTRVLLVPGHMLMMFATGIEADSDGYNMNDMYVVHDGMLWVPVETTLVGKSFPKAWEAGAAAYYGGKKGGGLAVFDVHEAWGKFKPASLPEDAWMPASMNREAIEKTFPGDMLSVLKISSQTMTRRYLQTIQQNPNDMAAHLQVGIILARLGDRAEAMKYFKRIVQTEPRNAAALNNLGNLHMLDGQYLEAQKSYIDAAKADPQDPEILVNLANAYKAAKNFGKAKVAFAQAQRIDPAVANKHKALALELLSALSDKEKAKPSRVKK